jgi:hypothetical protein
VISQLGEDEVLDDLITFHKKSRKMARLVSGAFVAASSASEVDDDDVYETRSEAQIYDNISLEPKETSQPAEKKRGLLEERDESRGSKYDSRSESTESIYVDPAEEAAVQASILAYPRRGTVVESIEYLQEIGNINGAPDSLAKQSESKIVMPTLAEIGDGEDEKSEDGRSDPGVASGRKDNCAWNYATALDENDVTSHRHLVCVPKSLNFSVILSLSLLPHTFRRVLGARMSRRPVCKLRTTAKVGCLIFLGLVKTVDWSLVLCYMPGRLMWSPCPVIMFGVSR